jgi:prepilin-type processing-associated H-X9-DG protein
MISTHSAFFHLLDITIIWNAWLALLDYIIWFVWWACQNSAFDANAAYCDGHETVHLIMIIALTV